MLARLCCPGGHHMRQLIPFIVRILTHSCEYGRGVLACGLYFYIAAGCTERGSIRNSHGDGDVAAGWIVEFCVRPCGTLGDKRHQRRVLFAGGLTRAVKMSLAECGAAAQRKDGEQREQETEQHPGLSVRILKGAKSGLRHSEIHTFCSCIARGGKGLARTRCKRFLGPGAGRFPITKCLHTQPAICPGGFLWLLLARRPALGAAGRMAVASSFAKSVPKCLVRGHGDPDGKVNGCLRKFRDHCKMLFPCLRP